MSALALALHLVLAAPGSALPAGLQPRLDPGPFQSREVVASSLGVLAGDALVLGGAYYTLQLFANGTLRPSADNFRSFAYGAAVAALLVPPLTSVLVGRWFRAEPASGNVWKGLLLAVVGQAAALAAGYYATPRFWVIPAVQMVTVSGGATVGLHWGSGPRATAPAPETRREAVAPPPASADARLPICPDPALAIAG
jgi:hypothetical protein